MAEDPNRFDPASQKRHKRYPYRASAWYCAECRTWAKANEGCRCQPPAPVDMPMVNTGDCFRGWYEHITPTGPVWCESKADLYRACEKHGVQARALMSGGKMKRPRGA